MKKYEMILMCLLMLTAAGCTEKKETVTESTAEETPERSYMTVSREIEEAGGITIQQMILPHDSPRRSGEVREIRGITIHETDNRYSTADAQAHGNMLLNDRTDITSWHYTVDDHAIVHHLPDNEAAWNAGDNRTRGGGNVNGIGIEMVVALGNDYEQTLVNTAELTAALLQTYGLTTEDIHMHADFMDKVCPHRLITEGRWDEFVGMVEEICAETEEE